MYFLENWKSPQAAFVSLQRTIYNHFVSAIFPVIVWSPPTFLSNFSIVERHRRKQPNPRRVVLIEISWFFNQQVGSITMQSTMVILLPAIVLQGCISITCYKMLLVFMTKTKNVWHIQKETNFNVNLHEKRNQLESWLSSSITNGRWIQWLISSRIYILNAVWGCVYTYISLTYRWGRVFSYKCWTFLSAINISSTQHDIKWEAVLVHVDNFMKSECWDDDGRWMEHFTIWNFLEGPFDYRWLRIEIIRWCCIVTR